MNKSGTDQMSKQNAGNRGAANGVGVKKLEDHRRLMLQQQLTGHKWDTVDSVKRVTQAPPPPVAPPSMGNMRGRPGSPALSGSSMGKALKYYG